MSTENTTEAPALRPANEALTRIAALWIWSVLSFFALAITLWGTDTTTDPSLQRMSQMFLYGQAFGNQPPVGSSSELFALLGPLSHLIAYTALTFAWFSLYRYFRFYVVPIAFLNNQPPDRGVDPRTSIAVGSLRIASLMLIFAVIARIVPFLMLQVLPHLLRAGV